MHIWRIPEVPSSAHSDAPLPSSIQQRGLCLMAIEFLTKYPAAECVVTSMSLPFWDSIFDLFPKTLFQVFSSPLEDPPRPNVIRHAARFDQQLAEGFGSRGAPYNLLFTIEDMDTQLSLYVKGKPTAGLLLVTQPVKEYLAGDLVYPMYCSLSSGLCGLVPLPGESRMLPYAGYYAAMREFHGTRGLLSSYDRDRENSAVTAYARSISGVGDAGSAVLVAEVVRGGLPKFEHSDAIFWEPPPQTVTQSELEALFFSMLDSGHNL